MPRRLDPRQPLQNPRSTERRGDAPGSTGTGQPKNLSGAQAYADAVRTAAADGRITSEEAENIRTLARGWNPTSGTGRMNFENDLEFETVDRSEADRLAAFLPRTTVGGAGVTRVRIASESFAQLNWIPPTQNTDGSALTDLFGYKIYYGRASGVYDKVLEISDPTATGFRVENLAKGTWFFCVKAVNNKGEQSVCSNEGTKEIK